MNRALLVLLALLVAGCMPAATEVCAGGDGSTPGFLVGWWHGSISPLTWFISLFSDDVAMYASENRGGWYDLGYLIGIGGDCACVGAPSRFLSRKTSADDQQDDDATT